LAQAVLSCVLIWVLATPAAALSGGTARWAYQEPPRAHATAPTTPAPNPQPSPSPSESPSAAPAGNAAGQAEGLASGVASGLATSALDSLFTNIGEAAVWAFGKVVGWVDATSSPDVTQPWFTEVYGRTYWLSAIIALIAFVWALTAGALRNGVTGMLSVIPRLLLVVLSLAVAVPLMQTLLEFTDWLSFQVGGEAGQNVREMAGALGAVLVGASGTGATVQSSVPGFVLALVALIIVVGSLLVWLQLILRTAVIYLLLAAAAFPAAMSVNRTSARPIRKIVAWMVAMAFAKPVIMLALWIGSAPFAAGAEADVAAVLTGAGVMVTAVFAPWALFRLFDYAGDQVASSVSASANPSQLRTHIEQPVTTYRRTAAAVQERATTVRERGVTSFTPTRSRVTVAAQAGGATAAAAGGRAVLRAATGQARRASASTEPGGRPPRATSRDGAPDPPPPPITGSAQPISPTGAARPEAPEGDPPRPPASWRPPVEPTGAHDDE
jgi:hypothetical protein